MDKSSHWSVEHCRWETSRPQHDGHWSVQRCRWEPCGPVADALATPWSIFAAEQEAVQVPAQRTTQGAPVEA